MGKFDVALFMALATDKLGEMRGDKSVTDADLAAELGMIAENTRMKTNRR